MCLKPLKRLFKGEFTLSDDRLSEQRSPLPEDLPEVRGTGFTGGGFQVQVAADHGSLTGFHRYQSADVLFQLGEIESIVAVGFRSFVRKRKGIHDDVCEDRVVVSG